MLSEKAIKMAEQLLENYRRLNELICEETDSNWSLYVPDHLHMSTTRDAEYVPSKQDLVNIVGPVAHYFDDEKRGTEFYTFKAGRVLFCASVVKQKAEGADK